MPGFNKTGPEGKGSMTGRGLGLCNNNNIVNNQDATNSNNDPNFQRPFNGPIGGAFRRGRGGGRGRGRGFACNGRRIRGNF